MLCINESEAYCDVKIKKRLNKKIPTCSVNWHLIYQGFKAHDHNTSYASAAIKYTSALNFSDLLIPF